ncbi:hypothetical protein OEA41_009308 [Lepraria neglecta]|uniref:Uncharacterized protein n=1 Tax=Lepraria neglecta TaxID=209136 RepID=A0AAD9Z1Q3_9LECA|nr:hypothetical protein OEA41_009308 [Lepraria neglecta]
MTEQGKHLHVQRVTLLQDTMKRGEPFGKIHPGTKAVINNILDELQPELLEGVESVFRGVSVNFDLICVVEELPDERRDAVRQRIKHYADYADYANSRIYGELTREFAMATKGSS